MRSSARIPGRGCVAEPGFRVLVPDLVDRPGRAPAGRGRRRPGQHEREETGDAEPGHEQPRAPSRAAGWSELLEQGFHRRPALGGVGEEAPQDGVAEARRDVGLGGELDDAEAGLLGDLVRARARERALAVEGLEQGDAEAELVAAGVDDLLEVALRSHVGRGPHDQPGRGDPGVEEVRCVHRGGRAWWSAAGRRGQAEVQHSHAAVVAAQDVGGLEVAMDQAHAVGGGQAPSRLHERVEDRSPRRQGSAEPALEGLAADVLHRDEHPAVHLAHVVDLDDVGVGEPGHRLGLAEQPLCGIAGPRGATAPQQLDRHDA